MKHLTLLITVCFFFGFVSGYGQQHISRIEPPNWWVDMVNNEVELLVYGEELGLYQASLKDYPGVKLIGSKTVPNDNYLFLTLEIGSVTEPGNLSLVFSQKNNKSFTYNYPLLKREKGSKQLKGFDSSDAIYLITPDRFSNGNKNNDTIDGLMDVANRSEKGGRHGGDIEGIWALPRFGSIRCWKTICPKIVITDMQ